MSNDQSFISERAGLLHHDAIVIDLVCPLVSSEKWASEMQLGGVTVAGATVAADEDCTSTMLSIGRWFERFRSSTLLRQVRSVADIFACKKDGQLGVIFHFQDTRPLLRNLELVEVYQQLGVRVVQLTYNLKNYVGDGCDETTDAGLSRYGQNLIREFNRVGILVDLSHTGYRTTMDAMEVSEQPVIFSHSNAYDVHASLRNIRDDQIKAVAAKGGVIGLNGFPAFVSDREWPTLDDLINHADHIAALVGTDHLSIGLDYYDGIWPIASQERAEAYYADFVKTGKWREGTYPRPPYRYPKGIETPRTLEQLTDKLLQRGFDDNAIRKILGQNLIRVFQQVWL